MSLYFCMQLVLGGIIGIRKVDELTAELKKWKD